MAVRIESLAEPLPGYRLIERLGGGGFGEVWKAEAPGGLFKAIKFVYGDLEATDDESARAGQEFKALQRVITVRHPFILSLERFDIIDGQLMIVMELADRTLWDRFRECRTQGLTGIPRDELLHYLSDTAEALDLMNLQYQLQHLDIKPQNLFLVHNHVKVADFGLVKDLEGILASVTGGVTPVYAAPETFEGKVSRFSDQYSLAIVYQELLTGQRPYSGTTLRQLVMQHCQGTPDLKSLPERDRPIVLRALSKRHDDRYPKCLDLVEALLAAGQPAVKPAGIADAAAAREIRQPKMATDGDKTEGSPGRRVASDTRAQETAAVAPPPPSDPVLADQFDYETPSIGLDACVTPSPTGKPPSEGPAEDVLLPALVLGLGTFGLGTLQQLRREIVETFGSAEALPIIRLLYLDTDPEIAQRATRGQGQIALRASEVLVTRLHRPSYYVKPREAPSGLQSWLHPKMLYRMPRQQTASGIRALGRLAFIDHYKSIARRLEFELKECCTKEAAEKAGRDTGLNLRSAAPRVYIVTSLAGGTGGGMFIDLAYLVQHQLRRLGFEAAEVVGLCYLPPADRDPRRTRELANAFAALTELNHFSAAHAVFSAGYELGESRPTDPLFSWKGPPFQRCQFLALPPGRESVLVEESDGAGLTFAPAVAATLSAAGRTLFAELATPLGRVADECRQQSGPATDAAAVLTRSHWVDGPGSAALFQMTGLYRLLWPRRPLLDHAAGAVCRRLVQRWISKDAKPIKETVQQWVQKKWEEHGFAAEQLISRYQQGCEQAFGKTPDTVFEAIHATVSAALAPQTGKAGDGTLNLAVVVQTMEQLEQLVGVPEECRTTSTAGESSTYEPGSLESALQSAAVKVVDRHEQKLAQLVVALIENPNFRLAGAEEALRRLHAQVEEALQSQEPLANDLQQRAAAVYKRIHTLMGAGNVPAQSPSPRKASFRRAPAGLSPTVTELLELLRSFPKCRYQALIMQRITALYVSLRGMVSDQLREVDFCRARLRELQSYFTDSTTGQTALPPGPAAGRYLFAKGCKSLEEAVRTLESSVNAAGLVELDSRMQALVRKQFKALVHVCMTSTNLLKALATAMQKEARSYLRSRLGETNAAEIYMEQFNDDPEQADQRVEEDLSHAFDRAAPEVVASSPVSELNMLAVPASPSEQRLRELVRRAADCQTVVSVQGGDEIMVYREHTLGCLADLQQLGPAAQEAYEKMTAQEHFTPHSRADIVEWGTRVSEPGT
jgi:hypothetical protein